MFFLLEVCQQLRALRGVTNDHLKTLRDILVDLRSDLGDDVKGMIFVETRGTAFALAKYITEELEMMGYRAAPFTGSKSSDSSEGILIFRHRFQIIARSSSSFIKKY